MKKVLCFLFCLALLFSLTGCGDNESTEKVNNAPQNIIDPSTVNFGYNDSNDTYERWYLQNTDDVTYIFFSDENEDIENYLCTYNFVKSGVVTISTPLVKSENNHLTSPKEYDFVIDIVFSDCFNAYDYSSDSYYSRGNVDEYNSYFADRVYTNDDKLTFITFNSDFTCNKSDKENVVTGTWQITSQNTVLCKFENESVEFSIRYNDDFTVKSIENGGDIFYAEIKEDETINKYKAY